MNVGTDCVSPGKRITENHQRVAPHATEKPDESSTSNDGWMWVAAILVAALLIVSGYFEQEAANHEAASAAGERYASNIRAPQTLMAGANSAGHKPDKGY